MSYTAGVEGYGQKLVAVTEKLNKMEEILKKLGELPHEEVETNMC